MSFRLIDSGWRSEFVQAVKLAAEDILIISPFVQHAAVQRLLRGGSPTRVLTRFNLNHFYEGVSDFNALHALLRHGAEVKGVRHLHSKMYIFGKLRAFVTSANLTETAVTRNHELGFVTDEKDPIKQCRQYFDSLWSNAEKCLTLKQLLDWERQVNRLRTQTVKTAQIRLKDYGSDLGFTPHISTSETDTSSLTRGFVKFFGEGNSRSEPKISVLKEVQSSGSHWACSYPEGKRPRSVQDGDVMFIARLVQDPQDILIYGRAIGLAHVVGRDDATPEDIALRKWKKKWPHYIRVGEPEFVDGALANGVSLNNMMDTLGWTAFASTTRNHERGKGNTNPRKAFMQQAAVELSSAGTAWLNDLLDKSFARHGRLPQADLNKLDRGTETGR